jgi:hypothetical protein
MANEMSDKRNNPKYRVLVDNNQSIDDYLSIGWKVKSIARQLGDRLNYFNINRRGYEYVGYGLSIKIEPTDNAFNLYVSYKDTMVMIEKDFYVKEYIPGKWEELVSALYENESKLLEEKRQAYKSRDNVLFVVKNAGIKSGKIEINPHFYIEEIFVAGEDYYDKGYSETRAIYYGNKVFSTNYSGTYPSSYNYVAGDWEIELEDYIRHLSNQKQQKFSNNSDDEIEQQLERLRKKYN